VIANSEVPGPPRRWWRSPRRPAGGRGRQAPGGHQPENTSTPSSAYGRRHSEVEAEEKLVPYRVVGGGEPGQGGGPAARSTRLRRSPRHPPVPQEVRRGLPGPGGQGGVITVPAYFNDAQRQATKEPGRSRAWRSSASSTSPPRPAGLRSRQEERPDRGVRPGRWHLRHLHPGLGEGVSKCWPPRRPHLGGDDYDQAVIDWLMEEFRKQHAWTCQGPNGLQRLREAAEKAKCDCPARRAPRSTCRSSRRQVRPSTSGCSSAAPSSNSWSTA